jgi:hypothetical protein
MKAKAIQIIFFILTIQSITICQTPIFEIEKRDTNYLNQVIFDNGDSTDIWEFKDDLKRGKYIVVSNHECGKDTLMIAEFIEDKVKHGKWTEWEDRLCGGAIEKDGSVSNWEYWSDKEISEIKIYNNNSIVKNISFHFGTNQPHMEHVYPDNALKFNEWTSEKVWSESGNLRWEKKLNLNGKMEHVDYYENGKIRSRGKLESHGTFQEEWEYFYPNGLLMAKGKFEEFGKGKVRYYTGQRTPKDEWIYWDEFGNQIAKVIFKDGEVLKFEKYQNKEIPFPEIEQMIYK